MGGFFGVGLEVDGGVLGGDVALGDGEEDEGGWVENIGDEVDFVEIVEGLVDD